MAFTCAIFFSGQSFLLPTPPPLNRRRAFARLLGNRYVAEANASTIRSVFLQFPSPIKSDLLAFLSTRGGPQADPYRSFSKPALRSLLSDSSLHPPPVEKLRVQSTFRDACTSGRAISFFLTARRSTTPYPIVSHVCTSRARLSSDSGGTRGSPCGGF